MGNAIESVKQRANFVVPGREEDGAAEVIERFVPNGDESRSAIPAGCRRI